MLNTVYMEPQGHNRHQREESTCVQITLGLQPQQPPTQGQQIADTAIPTTGSCTFR